MLVVGPASTLRDDLDLIPDGWADRVLAVNGAAWIYPGRITDLVSIHSEKLDGWLAKRRELRGIEPIKKWGPANKPYDLADEVLPHWGVGTSGLFGVTVALHIGADRVILAGVPMQGGSYAAPDASTWDGNVWPDSEAELHRPGWEYHRHRMDRVRSCSGWTRDLLGGPEDWLAD